MKSHEKIVVGVIVAIFAVIILIFLVNGNNNNNNGQQAPATTAKSTPQQSASSEEFVQVVNGDVKLNKSSKLNETKTFDGMEISNVQITEKDGVTQLIAEVKNTTNTTKGGYPVKLNILDKNGNTITEGHGYIAEIAAGKTTQLSISKTFDFANAYDYTIEKE